MSKTRMILLTIGLAVGAGSLYLDGISGKLLAGIILIVFITTLIVQVLAQRKRARR